MSNIFKKNKLTYLGMYDDVKIYSEKQYTLIYADGSSKESLRVFYKGNEIALALRLVGPVNRIEEIEGHEIL